MNFAGILTRVKNVLKLTNTDEKILFLILCES
jgi:hypothetical protein